jgi:hypothetical protein
MEIFIITMIIITIILIQRTAILTIEIIPLIKYQRMRSIKMIAKINPTNDFFPMRVNL